jgi:hypothetical protein
LLDRQVGDRELALNHGPHIQRYAPNVANPFDVAIPEQPVKLSRLAKNWCGTSHR